MVLKIVQVVALIVASSALWPPQDDYHTDPTHLSRVVPTTFADIKEAARLFHINRPVETIPPSTRPLVILVTVSNGYLDFFRNWLFYFRKLGLDKFIVIAEDQLAYNNLTNDHRLDLKGRLLLADDTEISKSFGVLNGTGAFRFLSSDFLVLMHRRYVGT